MKYYLGMFPRQHPLKPMITEDMYWGRIGLWFWKY